MHMCVACVFVRESRNPKEHKNSEILENWEILECYGLIWKIWEHVEKLREEFLRVHTCFMWRILKEYLLRVHTCFKNNTRLSGFMACVHSDAILHARWLG